MHQATKRPFTASAANLRRLAIIRLILVSALLAALAYAYLSSGADMIHPSYLSILAVLALINTLTYWRLQQPWPVTDLEYFSHLMLDLIGLTVLLYYSGGASNPFVSYYLVPLTISAAILPWRYTWFIAGITLTTYSLMLFYYHPLPLLQPASAHAGHQTAGVNMHIIGMWLTFVLSSGLITFFVVRMANALRQQDQQQTANREAQLRDQQIMAVATLAAGTAHELGTPLATMTVLLDEMEFEHQQHDTVHADLKLLKKQLASCKQILRGLVSTAENHSNGQTQIVAVDDYLEEILTQWQVLRPAVSYQFSQTLGTGQHLIELDITLKQAIINLLNNAADACPDNIEITLGREANHYTISIRDHGAGIPLDIAEQLGKPFISTKGQGLGLGLFLSHATVSRYGGSIALYNCAGDGTLAELTLPAHYPPSNQSNPDQLTEDS
jgi:two-component system sensor histidine kinase RegB